VDREEVARRLEEIRKEVRARLAERAPGALDDGLPEEVPFHLEPRIGLKVGGEPSLTTTDDLAAANLAVDIRAPVPSGSPLLNLLRRITQPIVTLFAGGNLARQQEFNSYTVRHLNELGRRLEERVRNLEEALEVWSEDPSGVETRLRRGLEDYDAALRQRHTTLFSALEEEVLVAHAAAEKGQRLEELVVERAQAVDRRFDEKDDVLNAALTEVQARQSAHETELDRIEKQVGEIMAMRSLLKKALDSSSGPRQGDVPASAVDVEPAEWSQLADHLGDEDYRAFQDRFRGEPREIADRMSAHVAFFAGLQGVVADLGCGRGEFLDLLAAADVEAVGVEINAADVEECRRRGHRAEVGDLFGWLDQQAEDSVGGIFMAQVIEHLPPAAWQRFVELAASRLRPGGRLIVETINPESLYAMARAYVIDPTHIRPVHPELLSFLSRRAGFHPVEVRYQAPVPAEERPAGLPFFEEGSASGLSEELRALKESLLRIDRICCAPQEYAMYAVRPDVGEPA